MNVSRLDSTRRNRLLAALAPQDYALLSPHLKDVTLNARDVLFDAQDDIEHVFFPHGGMVSLFAITDEGETIETAAVGIDGAVGAAAGLGGRRAFCRAMVQVPGSAARISSAALHRVAGESEAVRTMLVNCNEALLMQSQQTALCSALHGVEERLARWLLQTQDRTGSNTVPLIQEFLAQVLGVRRTTINLVIRNLNEAGLVRYRRGHIEVVDRSGLQSQCCNCYDIVRRQMEQITPAAEEAPALAEARGA